ncbi:MAG: hypothetical protein AUG51_23455 [Acidobacteria bacterium 13_1_20CM_3_53_8]|nr:MAG: hypothetical protein AUG51_23455 [Acidobacteria bacterium 13_1_20CM_3_53_8]
MEVKVDEATAKQIALKVVADVNFYIAVIGLLGVIVGAVSTALGNLLIHWLKERSRAKAEKPRKELLLKMLNDERFPQRWRSFDTLKHVIGADDKTAKRLLIEIGARASEKKQDLWGLLKYHPLNETDQ